ncbi:MAG: DUF2802 domain-containing protein [Thiobacillus sp.]|nr:DUF2802 domain-containing protein [Thiobacillus sp.]
MEFSISLQDLLIALVLATVIYLLESALFSRRRRKSAGTDGIETVKAQMANLSQRLDALEARLGDGEADAAEVSHAAYDYAVQYARQGMIAPEIAARCGISRDEAALIVAMHRKGTEA